MINVQQEYGTPAKQEALAQTLQDMLTRLVPTHTWSARELKDLPRNVYARIAGEQSGFMAIDWLISVGMHEGVPGSKAISSDGVYALITLGEHRTAINTYKLNHEAKGVSGRQLRMAHLLASIAAGAFFLRPTLIPTAEQLAGEFQSTEVK